MDRGEPEVYNYICDVIQNFDESTRRAICNATTVDGETPLHVAIKETEHGKYHLSLFLAKV